MKSQSQNEVCKLDMVHPREVLEQVHPQVRLTDLTD